MPQPIRALKLCALRAVGTPIDVASARLAVCFGSMRFRFPWSITLACVLGCGSAAAVNEQPVYSAADDEAVLRDPVLDAVANPDATRRPTRGVPPSSRADAPATTDAAQPPQGGRQRVGIRGITGSLTAFEVDEAMATRGEALMACVQQRPNRLGYVAGDIKFHMDIDARGKADRVRITASNIGEPTLEACLSAVVATAPFPAPAGQQRAEATWQMSVDPLGRAAEPIDSAELEDAIARQSAATYEACGVGQERRFAVTAYINRGGEITALSVRAPSRGADPATDDGAEEIACLTQSLTEWKELPRASHNTKTVFELRWVAAPVEPPRRARGRGRNESRHHNSRGARRGR